MCTDTSSLVGVQYRSCFQKGNAIGRHYHMTFDSARRLTMRPADAYARVRVRTYSHVLYIICLDMI